MFVNQKIYNAFVVVEENHDNIRHDVSFEEMMEIAEALGVGYEQAFVLPDGEKIEMQKKL